jgi:predicted DNA-binding protein YlxM (UPF0122 family)
MFEKNMRYGLLLDAYGAVLDDHSRAIMTAYYEDDLSLAEIADGEGISRQGVRHIIKKSEETLDSLESALRITEKDAKINNLLGELRKICNNLSASDIPEASKLKGSIEKLLDDFLQ